MNNPHAHVNFFLFMGSLFSFAFAVFQFSAIFWSQDVLRYFGGPVSMQAENPFLYVLVCVGVAALVAIAGLYTLSGAGRFRPLPFMRTMCTVVTAIYILRGLELFVDLKLMRDHPEKDLQRFAVYSVIALSIGVIHLVGVIGVFKHPRSASPSKP